MKLYIEVEVGYGVSYEWVKYNATSKGSQPKAYNNGYIYKKNFVGDEAECEYLISQFLKSSGIKKFIEYEKVDDETCRSRDFTQDGYQFVTFWRCIEMVGQNPDKVTRGMRGKSAQYVHDYIVEVFVKLGVNRKRVKGQLAKMFELDWIVLNEDRHWNNFGLMVHLPTGKKDVLVFFDMGYSLLTTTKDTTAPMTIQMREVKARTISSSFSKQIKATEGYHFKVSRKFLKFLEERDTYEAKVFRSRLRMCYKI